MGYVRTSVLQDAQHGEVHIGGPTAPRRLFAAPQPALRGARERTNNERWLYRACHRRRLRVDPPEKAHNCLAAASRLGGAAARISLGPCAHTRDEEEEVALTGSYMRAGRLEHACGRAHWLPPASERSFRRPRRPGERAQRM